MLASPEAPSPPKESSCPCPLPTPRPSAPVTSLRASRSGTSHCSSAKPTPPAGSASGFSFLRDLRGLRRPRLSGRLRDLPFGSARTLRALRAATDPAPARDFPSSAPGGLPPAPNRGRLRPPSLRTPGRHAPTQAAAAFVPLAVLAVPFRFCERLLRESAGPEKIRGHRFSPSRSDLVTRR